MHAHVDSLWGRRAATNHQRLRFSVHAPAFPPRRNVLISPRTHH